MNWAKVNRGKLSLINYVRKADPKTNYWLDLSHNKINYYRKLTNDRFNIIVYGDDSIKTDFYVIPYEEIKHLLVKENFAKSDGRRRWIGSIINHYLSLTNTDTKHNVADKHGVYSSDYNSGRSFYLIGSKYGELANISMLPAMISKEVIAIGFTMHH